MAATKTKNRTDRQAHLARVSEYRSQGYSLREIGKLTNRSHGQICKDLKACDDIYRKSIAAHSEEYHRTAMMGHEQLLKTAWRSFRESKQKVIETATIDPATGDEVTMVSIQDDALPGDPRFLKIGLDAWKGLRDLMGLDAPMKTENTTTLKGVREDDELTDDDLERIIRGDYEESGTGLLLNSGTLVPFETLRKTLPDPFHRVDVSELRNGNTSDIDSRGTGEG
jgi:hypothetical protein